MLFWNQWQFCLDIFLQTVSDNGVTSPVYAPKDNLPSPSILVGNLPPSLILYRRFRMESMETLMASLDSHSSSSSAASDAARLADVQSWLSSLFDQANRQVPDLTLTPTSIKLLHSLASLSQSRSRAAAIVAPDLRQKASEYRAEAARIREILSSAGLGREHLSPSAMGSAQAVAEVANLLGIRDTETSR